MGGRHDTAVLCVDKGDIDDAIPQPLNSNPNPHNSTWNIVINDDDDDDGNTLDTDPGVLRILGDGVMG